MESAAAVKNQLAKTRAKGGTAGAVTIWETDLAEAGHPALTVIDEKQISRSEGTTPPSFDRPWVIPAAETVFQEFQKSPMRLNHMVFKAAFNRSKVKRDFKGITESADLRVRTLKLLSGDALACTELQQLHKVHVWGYAPGMVSYAPDVNCAGAQWSTGGPRLP